jgi:hypothetical protein
VGNFVDCPSDNYFEGADWGFLVVDSSYFVDRVGPGSLTLAFVVGMVALEGKMVPVGGVGVERVASALEVDLMDKGLHFVGPDSHNTV